MTDFEKNFSSKECRLVEWLQRVPDGRLLESQVVSSGLSRAIDGLLVKGIVTIEPHPTVMERTTPPVPASAVKLLERWKEQR